VAVRAVEPARRCAWRAISHHVDRDDGPRLPDRGGSLKSHRVALSTGLTSHVLEWYGPGETTFFLIHGFLDLAYGWHQVAERLAAHVHVVAVDLRGHGDSDWIGAGGYYHFLDYLADVDELIARFAKPRLVVVGHSMGGSVAMYWAGTRPDRIAALALLEGLGPPDQNDIPLPARTAGWLDAWRRVRTKPIKTMASLDEAVARLRKHDALLDAALARRLAAHGTREVPGGLVWKHDPLHATMGPYPFRVDAAAQYWRQIACPILVVDGAETRLNLPEPERAARRAYFANHRHVVLPGAGHMMHRHQPDALAALLLEQTTG
jgi:pimeloyl-ACP methyl ester carboxylesterase